MNSRNNRTFLALTARTRGGDTRRHSVVVLGCAAALLAVGGCGGKPNQANIELRKQLAARDDELARLRLERQADRATIEALQGQAATPPVVSVEKLQSLFTTHGIRLGRLTGFAYDKPGDGQPPHGIKVYVIPHDADQDELKAAGAITVEAFDLTSGGQQVGKWHFPTAEAMKRWNGQGLLYEYVLVCPFEGEVPSVRELTLRVTFVDELTGRSFTQQQVIRRQ